ncbi:MAG: peptidoglycan DD-metalloendopeptidase family protein [Bacteroidota bacterium]
MNFTRNILSLVLVFFCFSAMAQQQSKEEMQRKTQDLMREIENMRQSLQETQKDKKSTLVILRGIERKMDLRNQLINNIKGEVYFVEKDIIRTYRDIDTLKRELSLLKEQYSQSVIYAYKNRSNYNFLNFVFSASHFSDVLRRISYLKTYRSFREQKAGDITRTQQTLEKKVESLTGKREEKSKALKEQSKQMSALEVEKKDKDKAISQLQAKEKELSVSMKKKENERKKIQNAIAAVIKREKEIALREARAAAAEAKRKADLEAKKNQANTTAGNATNPASTPGTVAPPKPVVRKPREVSVLENTPEGVITSQEFEKNKGNLPWPVDKGQVSLHYGDNRIPGKTRDIIVYSPGISIETAIGASVKAIFDGEVASVSNLGDRQLIILKHGKYFTTYSNLQTVSVSRGQKVSRGQVMGQAGSNDEGVGSMDLQMDTERGTINPEQWIRRR